MVIKNENKNESYKIITIFFHEEKRWLFYLGDCEFEWEVQVISMN